MRNQNPNANIRVTAWPWKPLLIVYLFWGGIIMTSIFGPYDYPLGGPVGWVLFLLFFAVIAIGYAVGIGY